MALWDYDNFVKWWWGVQTWRLRYKAIGVVLLIAALWRMLR